MRSSGRTRNAGHVSGVASGDLSWQRPIGRGAGAV